VLSAARRSSDPASMGLALLADADLSRLLGDSGRALERSEELLALSAEHDMRLLMLYGTVWRGWAVAGQGQVETRNRAATARQASRSSASTYPNVLLQLAEVYRQGARPEEGLDVVAEGLARARKSGAVLFPPALYTIKGAVTRTVRSSNLYGRNIFLRIECY
jgi:hypothetical protein